MPFYIRKSVSAGPFRLNFSKGGVGMSVGVKGLRLGTGPRGHYIHAGRGGLYYRSTLGRAGQKKATHQPAPPLRIPNTPYEHSDVHMVEIESSDVLQMTDSSVSEIISDLNSLSAKSSPIKAVAWIGGLIGFFILFNNITLGMLTWVATALACSTCQWIESYQRRTALFYDLEPDATQSYQNMVSAFDNLNLCAGKWHRVAIGQINTLTLQKRNAGASQLVNRNPINLTYELPSLIASNITPPSCKAGRQTLYFFPDMVLVQDGKKFGAVSYEHLRVSINQTNFIEEGSVPSDAKIIRYTWQHPNKNGGPDRRFAHNRQIPVCLYETMHLTSSNGLNEMFEFSRVGSVQIFSHSLSSLAQTNSTKPNTRASSPQYA